MSTKTPEHGIAKTLVVEPGNGSRYFIVYGTDFVALPDFNTAATMTPFPNEYGYIQSKLGLSKRDAKVVFEALRATRVPAEDDERGPNARFQMYSREGNDEVADMLRAVLASAEGQPPKHIKEILRTAVAEVAAVHPEVHDTEPEWAIVDEMNAWLEPNGYAKIDRDDLRLS